MGDDLLLSEQRDLLYAKAREFRVTMLPDQRDTENMTGVLLGMIRDWVEEHPRASIINIVFDVVEERPEVPACAPPHVRLAHQIFHATHVETATVVYEDD